MIEIIATSTMGLESVVARELKSLGYEPKNIEVGRTLFTGSERDICRANIHLRCAGHVLIRVGEFPCEDFGQLFDQTVELPWERWLPKNACFPVDGRSVRSTLSSVPAVQGVVKKAIVTRLQKAWKTETLPEDGPKYPVEISLLKDRATLTIDTTGEGLHRRGYRKLVGAAPLRETLAAGLVLLSYWNRERPLLDPFCGSGTIPIEAALIGRNIAPGLRRSFVSEAWSQIPFQDWVDVRLAAKEAILPDVPAPILGCDLDPEAVEMAQYHAQMAGVSNDVRFECRDFLKTESSDEYGCTIMNPPYGKWIGEYSELKALYFAIPSVLQKLPTWSHYIYTAFPDFERLIGQEASRRRKIYNSRLECTYYQFFGPRPPRETAPAEVLETSDSEPLDQPAAPVQGVFGGLSDSVKNSAGDFERRLEKLNHHLRRWPTKRGITCFRVYDRDIPEIPLAIDRYEDCLHIAEYDRPNDRNAAQQGQWMDLMVEIAGRVLDVPKEKIFVKRRQRQRG
ncbi:MAG: bifunctional 23S rRNA (guanine(2069)-N(7))-methyltransferase RlmK/23S rRNA (guanine(2445)-N(2))-methyltransferase RlmL, partial [Thermoguttaceae bacterium]|nr:bifunctional 23S rRNA (guanine(2069)-N(7))-methyltransferase RlmK/23S rRNA (guanine(2445)-N(2))-methyltransferase RlmL [Thermoguttaceae bacterium]